MESESLLTFQMTHPLMSAVVERASRSASLVIANKRRRLYIDKQVYLIGANLVLSSMSDEV